jgi:hypothetical protein
LTLLVARLAKLEGVSLCPNYLVTTNALELKERSLYVAHELAQMVPLSGMDVYSEVMRINSWMADYLPNALGEPETAQAAKGLHKYSLVQSILEMLFRSPLARRFETWEMNRKIKKLAREQSSSFESHFSADVCKGHIDRHGENVVTALAVRLQRATAPALTEGVGEVATTEPA